MPERLYTIGFTGKSAEAFFETLRSAGAARLLDVRLKNTSQLAGFTKRDDLSYLLRALLGMGYAHLPELAPTEELMSRYKADKDWEAYARDFAALLAERGVEITLDLALFEPRAVLLCSEPGAERCHRSLVAAYLKDRLWPDLEIQHL